MKYLSLIVALLLVGSCKKSDVTEPTPDEVRFSLLVDRKWMIVEERVRDSSGHVSDNYWPSQPSYLKDDYTIWRKDLTYITSDSTDRQPFPTGSILDSGTWQLKDAVITMVSSKAGMTTYPMKVANIAGNSLTIEVEDPAKSGTGIFTLTAVP